MKNSNPVRGSRDILPEDMRLRDELEQRILRRYRAHGFSRIETPIMENLDLLLASEGGENLKMLFTILKRGQKLKPTADSQVDDLCDLGLRFDLTLPLSRFYANNQALLEMPFKAIQIGNVFRAERPQKGRFRSFKQCDIDIIGDPSINAEIELIDTTAKALIDLGFSGFTIKINHRQLLSQVIEKVGFAKAEIGSVCITLDKLDKIGIDRVKKELGQKGYPAQAIEALMVCAGSLDLGNLAKWVDDQTIASDLKILMEAVAELSDRQYTIEFDFSLIRGMGYYTGLIFEVAYGPYGYSIAGGGRYDNMIGRYQKQPIPAVGFSIGFERIIEILKEEDLVSDRQDPKIILFYEPEQAFAEVIKAAKIWREKGYATNLVMMKKKFGKQIAAYKKDDYLGFLVFKRDEELKKF